MKVETVRFGALDIPDDRVLDFPEGLAGFNSKRYVLVPEKEAPILDWLQSLDEPEVVLLLIDPTIVIPSYAAQPKPAEMRPIKDERSSEKISCRVIARQGERSNELLLNLFAPIFFNFDRKMGMQVPLVGSGYSVRQVWPARPGPAEESAAED